MALNIRYFERDIVTPGPGLTELNVPAKKFQGFDPATGLAILEDLTPLAEINTSGVRPPVAGSISGSMPTATTATVTVVYVDPQDGRPPVLTWHWYRDGVERGTTTEPTRTFLFPSVPNDSNAHTYFAVGESDDGIGDPSNLLSLTWGGSSVVAPTAPTQFARNNLTTAQVDFIWTVPDVDARVDKLALFRQGQVPGTNAPLVDNIDSSSLAYTLVFSSVGINPGDQVSNIGVARHIPTAGAPNNGWSSISNVLSFRVPVVSVVHDVVMGSTVNDEWTSGKVTQYPLMASCRTYRFDQAVSDQSLTGARVLGITPNGSGENVGNPRSVDISSAVLDLCETFYYNTDGTPRSGARSPSSGTELHIALDNETDRGANPNTIFINNHRDARTAIHTPGSVGTTGRRYPLASLWVDMTQNNIRNGGSGTSFKPIARYLDGFGCSMYPPGRQAQANAGACDNNLTFSTYSSYIDEVVTTIQDWMLTGGATGGVSPIKMFATWEFGIGIDHPFRTGGTGNCPCNASSGEPTDLTNFTIRPRYLAGGIDSNGKDWTGFLQYMFNALDAIGCSMREQLYWNQQSAEDKPNQLWHDQRTRAWDARTLPAPCGTQNSFGSTRANPDSETAWFNWTPGSRLAHG